MCVTEGRKGVFIKPILTYSRQVDMNEKALPIKKVVMKQ